MEEHKESGQKDQELPAEKTETKSWHWLLQGLLFLVIAIGGAAAVACLPAFTLQDIRVEGNSYVPAEEICRIAGVYRGEHMLQVKTDAAARTLVRDLRIEQAEVRRVFPGELVIAVKERLPVARVVCDYGYLDVDHEGMVLNAYRTPRSRSIPLITGVKLHDLYIGDAVADDSVQKLLAYLNLLNPGERQQINEIALVRPDYAVAYTTGAVQIRIGALDRLDAKAALTQDFLAELKTAKHPIAYIDLSFATPFIRMTNEPGSAGGT